MTADIMQQQILTQETHDFDEVRKPPATFRRFLPTL